MYVEFGDTSYTVLAGKQGGTAGVVAGALEYNGYLNYDNQPYLMKYQSNDFTFGDSVRQKFVKQVDFTLASTFIDAPAVVRWGYDGLLSYSANKTINAQQPALFNVAYFNQGEEFGSGLSTFKRYRTNTKGSGQTVAVGLEVEIAGNSLAIQEINIQTLIGRIY